MIFLLALFSFGRGASAAGVCRVSTSSSSWSEYGSRNAYTTDGVTHKNSICDGSISWQSSGSSDNITVAECAAQAKKRQAKCFDYVCPYKLAANCTCPVLPPKVVPVPGATRVACVGDSITAGYLSSCGLNYPAQLQTLLGPAYNVTNYGVGGRTMLQQAHLPAGDRASYWNTSQYKAALGSGSDVVLLMLGTNDAMAARWALSGAAYFPADYALMADSFLALSPKPALYMMVPPPLYRDGRYNMNQTVINSIFPGSGPASIRSIAKKLQLKEGLAKSSSSRSSSSCSSSSYFSSFSSSSSESLNLTLIL